VTLSSPTPFTGGLYTQRPSFGQKAIDVFSSLDRVNFASIGNNGWFHMELSSVKPLAGENPSQGFSEFQYDFLFRSGTLSRFLLVSTHSQLVDTILTRSKIGDHVYRPDIDVSRLVNDLAKQPAKYSMGAVFARFEGQAQALRRAGFYGFDLGESEVFRRLLSEMVPFRVNLRDVVKQAEIVGVGSKGEVSFVYTGLSSIRDADSALGFLSSRGYLNWEAEGEE
jgi:hypothetical protein